MTPEEKTSMNRPNYALVSLMCAAFAGAVAGQNTSAPANAFIVHNLVSDLPNIADHQDPNLVNPWGNGFGTSPFWTANNGTGTSTLYNGYGTKAALTVTIPAAAGATTPGPVTGVVSNTFSATNKSAFVVGAAPASFIFCSLDGIITGWNGAAGTKAVIMVDNSKSGAVYTGCTVGGTAAAPMIYAANLNSGKIDVFDANFKPVTSLPFTALLPAGYAPYNIQSFGGKLWVTYAVQNAQKNNVVFGAGNGAVMTFNFNGTPAGFATGGGPLNAPWGVVVAPATFGPFANDVLVGNFGDGKINAFDPATGAFVGTLNNASTGGPIVLPGLWSLAVGSGAQNEDPGTVYFTAGIGGGPNGAPTASDPIQSHGLLGSIQGAPSFQASGTQSFLTFTGNVSAPSAIQNGASFASGAIAPNTWMTIRGADLSPISANWNVTGTTLPTTLENVKVTINGEPAFIGFVGNQQINFLTPADLVPGTTPQIVVTSNGLSSATVTGPAVQAAAPAFFTIGTGTQGQNYIAATHADGTLIGPSTIKGATGAKAGETIVLYGTGFGVTGMTVPNGETIGSAIALPITPTVTIEGKVAQVSFGGLTGAGLYQFNVVVPAGLPAGDALVVALAGNSETQPGAFITISQ